MVMETDLRPQRTNSRNYSSSNSLATTSEVAPLSELFICFTSKLASATVAASATPSMKLPPSKSVLSPGRARDPHSSSSQISLSTSLSRRLRTNGSIKGGQASPMFPPGPRPSAGSGGKRKGSAFESPEPSSPKVTCIGQVRVKGKRHGRKKISKQGNGGDSSFRGKRDFCSGDESSGVSGQCCVNRNVKWVHLPLTICEGLRALGADLNCLFPCRSGFCVNGKNDGNGNEEDRSGGGFCGAVFARWVVEDGVSRGKKIELVMGDEDDGGAREMGVDTHEIEGRSYRKNGLEHIEFNDIQNLGGDGGRVSICIPPKNALLLMRCRSDPVKMAALANKFFEAPPPPPEEDEEEGNSAVDEGEVIEDCRTGNKEQEKKEEKSRATEEVVDLEDDKTSPDADVWEEHDEDEREIPCIVETNQMVEKMEDSSDGFHSDERVGEVLIEDEDFVEKDTVEENDQCQPQQFLDANLVMHTRPSLEQSHMEENQNNDEKISSLEDEETLKEIEETMEVKEVPEIRNDNTLIGKANDKPALPDCLLLMMCEPKLSMEVSKETWVCSTDFIRWVPGGRPKRQVKKAGAGGDDLDKKMRSGMTNCTVETSGGRCSVFAGDQESKGEENSKINHRVKKTNDEKPLKFQPPRSSCHYPSQQSSKGEAISMAIEKKLVGSKGYEPFVLTRCKSEPMRTGGTKLVPQDI